MSKKPISIKAAWILGGLGLLGVIITKIDKLPDLSNIFTNKLVLKSKILKPTNYIHFTVTDSENKIINGVEVKIYNKIGKDNIPTSTMQVSCDSTGLYVLRLLNYENIIQISKKGYEPRSITITPDKINNNILNLGNIKLLNE